MAAGVLGDPRFGTAGEPAARLARRIVLTVPALLLAGAYVSQYGFGLYPCEMCWWQRYAHFATLALGVLALLRPRTRALSWLAALALLFAGLLGGYHAGVEYHWWQGFTACTAVASHGGNALDAILNAPMIRCDTAQWTLLGISLAGYNFLISTAAALVSLWLLGRAGRPA
ncbi:disulfide bond formation protein B [Parablastomonas sp. CN1-191]|uniref:disulfide bond formation protein B n=1 Tax=Parablastomonas sp. CN1-191 TaxID=3400908 RepID=UPI003BF8A322